MVKFVKNRLCLIFANAKFIFSAFIFLATIAAGFAGKTNAQTAPNVLITWKAFSYAPADFRGKIFPTTNSLIKASLEIINNGKVADLSGQKIYWYLNDEPIKIGRGLQSIEFNLNTDPSVNELSVQIPSYPSGFFLRAVNIPVVAPEAVIEAPYPDWQVRDTNIKVKGLPYFFNIADPLELSFLWNANGAQPQNQENPSDLTINFNPTDSSQNIDIGLTIQKGKDESNSAFQNATLTFVK